MTRKDSQPAAPSRSSAKRNVTSLEKPLLENDTSSSSAHNNDDFQPLRPGGPPLPFPDSKATARQVRTYIHNYFLRSAEARDIEPAEVERLSHIWKHGTGADLRTYTLSTFQKMYGAELGPILYDHVYNKKNAYDNSFAMLFFAVGILGFPGGVSLLVGVAAADHMAKPLRIVGTILLILATIFFISSIFSFWRESTKQANIKKTAEEFYGSRAGKRADRGGGEMPLAGRRLAQGKED